ncbi:MAG: bis(5'-nucleosyl)-tetraphosphatase (symmetrical) YqeK [Candidatus Sumerlaeota bacterium]|nr:bis(5'-nucleosyl)-tetraphosphatase (symmetrical) YqeK [Candidatus Sumerlaeota bacterium]
MNSAQHLDAYIRAAQQLQRPRFQHVLGVAHNGAVLADQLGLDPVAAAAAGLLHDLAKETPPDKLKSDLERRGHSIGPEDIEFPKLWHALAAAMWAEQDFGVTDADVLEAIRVHPTADRDISPLAQIIFLADYTDPTRDWKGVERLRHLARADFPAAFAEAVEYKMARVRLHGYVVHPRAQRAFEAYGRRSEPLVKEGMYD